MAKNAQVIGVLASLPIVTLTLAVAFRVNPAFSSILGWMSAALFAAPAIAGVIVLVVPRLRNAAISALAWALIRRR